MPTLDQTHDPSLRSWVESANEPNCDFPIQNLPFGVFRRKGATERPRIGVAIGDCVLDVAGCVEADLLDGIDPESACVLSASSLNQFMAKGRRTWSIVRHALNALLQAGNTRLRDDDQRCKQLLVSMQEVECLLHAQIGDYTDFYA